MFKDFLKAAGFNSAKAYYTGAKLVGIVQKNEELIITLSINGGATGKARGFRGNKDLPSIHDSTTLTDRALGEQIKDAWLKCVDNSV